MELVTSMALPARVMVVSIEEAWVSVELQEGQRSCSLKNSSVGYLTSGLSVLNHRLQRLGLEAGRTSCHGARPRTGVDLMTDNALAKLEFVTLDRTL